MNFEKVQYKNKTVGYKAQLQEHTLFYGNNQLIFDNLKELFPQFSFFKLKQVHGSQIVDSSQQIVEADGHFTSTPNQALCILTADCLPIFLIHPQLTMALHAGWRGLDQGIIIKSLEVLNKHDLNWHEVRAFIGPHIQASHFEVGQDVALQIHNHLSHKLQQSKSSYWLKHDNPEKAYMDLSFISKYQLIEMGLTESCIFCSEINTYTNDEFPSYRRNKNNPGRIISFAAK